MLRTWILAALLMLSLAFAAGASAWAWRSVSAFDGVPQSEPAGIQ